MGMRIVAELSSLLGRPLRHTMLWEYPTVSKLVRFLSTVDCDEKPTRSTHHSGERDLRASSGHEPIAIVGIGCRLPGGLESPRSFWQALTSRRNCIREVPSERWNVERWFAEDPSVPGKMSTRWGGFLDAVDRFDAGFFGVQPSEARQMDPQQRLILETAWESLENAGLIPGELRGTSAGVFIGTMWGQYPLVAADVAKSIDQHSAVGWDTSIISGRLAYALGLQGPALTVNTACSSSLVAVHLACESLRKYECELALAGGVNLMLTPHGTVQLSKLGVMNPRGQCRAFDAQADGYVRGEGCAVVALKRLADAIADGARVYAVIRGSALNHAGFSNGLTGPNPAAQSAVLRSAWARADVAPGSVAYVESHATGTLLGDSIEADALGEVFAPDRRAPLCIGSVKTNLGHLEAAAGIAGLLKVALSLHHGAIPPNLHFDTPSPHIAFEAMKLRVVDRMEGFARGPVRYAGVSSFGFGGTNAHLALSEAPGRTQRVIALASDSAAGLRREAKSLAGELIAVETDENLSSFATAQHGTGGFRATLFGKDASELEEALRQLARGRSNIDEVAEDARRCVFVFGGQGGQWAGMALDLLATNTYFQAAIRACDHALAPWIGWSVRRALANLAPSALTATGTMQPVLFALQVSLARTLMHWGLIPDAVVGQSMGEVAASVVSGALSLADGARVISARARLVVERARGGGALMVAELSADEAEAWLTSHSEVSIAVYASPRQVVLSGQSEPLQLLAAKLEQSGRRVQRVLVDYASHSAAMDPVLPELGRDLEHLRPNVPAIPMWSTVDNDWIGPTRALDAAYFCDNLRAPVRLRQSIERLHGLGFGSFIEIGPHPVVKTALEATLQAQSAPAVRCFASCVRDEPAGDGLLELAAACWRQGAPIQWDVVAATTQPPSSERRAADVGPEPCVLPVSGRDEGALRAQAGRLAAWLTAHPEQRLVDVAYSLALHRTHFAERAAVVASDRGSSVEALEALAQGQNDARVVRARVAGSAASGKVAFVFPGQGGPWSGIGKALLSQSRVFAESMRACDAALSTWTGWSVLSLLRGDAGGTPPSCDRMDAALFAVGVSLSALWRSLGLEPAAVVGHGQGEVAAAVACGALSLEDGARVVAARSLELPDAAMPLSPRAGQIPFYSTVERRCLRGEELDGSYWDWNRREPVRLESTLSLLLQAGYGVFVELSAHPVLEAALRSASEERGGVVIGSLAREQGDLSALLRGLGELHTRGVSVSWSQVYAESHAGSVELPTYAFQREQFWLDSVGAQSEPQVGGSTAVAHPGPSSMTPLADDHGDPLSSRHSRRVSPADPARVDDAPSDGKQPRIRQQPGALKQEGAGTLRAWLSARPESAVEPSTSWQNRVSGKVAEPDAYWELLEEAEAAVESIPTRSEALTSCDPRGLLASSLGELRAALAACVVRVPETDTLAAALCSSRAAGLVAAHEEFLSLLEQVHMPAATALRTRIHRLLPISTGGMR